MNKPSPATLADLIINIREQYNQLSKRLRQVAEFVLESPDDVAFGTVAVLSKNADVHPSTWVRFAHTFGFSGFSEMQKLFQTKLMEETPNYQERIRLSKQQLETRLDVSLEEQHGTLSPIDLLTQFSHANAQALEYLADSIPAEDLNRAINILADAHSSHIIGVRRAFVVASYFAYALHHIDQKAYLMDGLGGMYQEQTSNLDQHDVLIAVSFYPYASETQTIAKCAVQKGVPLIVISDSSVSPLATMATVNFVVKEAEVQTFRSLSSSLVLAQSLSIGLAYELENRR